MYLKLNTPAVINAVFFIGPFSFVKYNNPDSNTVEVVVEVVQFVLVTKALFSCG